MDFSAEAAAWPAPCAPDDEYPAGRTGDAALRELTDCGRLARVACASPANRAALCAAAYAVAWPIVFNRLTKSVELRRGHRRCARSVNDMAPECLDRFHDDVEAVVDDLLRHADRPIRNLEAWICTRLTVATVNAHRRQRGARGALQRPRLPKWLSSALGADPWLTDLALQILVWVGIDATPGAGLWPLDSWTRRRAELTGDPTVGPATVEREVEQVLAVMRGHGAWYADYVERPFGHKQAPVLAWIAPAGAAAEPPPLPLADPAEANEARLVGLAQDALAEIRRRLAEGLAPQEAVAEVIRCVFAEDGPAPGFDRPPHDAPSQEEHVNALLRDPAELTRIVTAVLDVVLAG
ncbi:MAG TPA: hypothetical protein VGX23_23365 [Actinocrinis sp.]|nr:hypothetical protein [Actinocrinis sp.]